MVKIVDGHKEREEALNRHRTLIDLAEKSFKGKIACVPYDSNTSIVVREDITGCDIDIFALAGSITVNKKSYFESARKFAEEAEKITGREFTLKTTYEL